MEDKTSLWNTKTSDLTVGDTVKLNILAPILVMGSMFGFAVVAGATSSAISKFRNRKSAVPQDQTDEQ